jgi:hypothetical protein
MQADTRCFAAKSGDCLWLGRLGVGLFVGHVCYCAATEHVAEAFWVCHVAFLVLSLGLWFHRPLCVNVGAFCLLVGTPAWLANVAIGLPIALTSAATHLIGFAFAIVGLRRMGVAPRSWIAATAFVGLVQFACRFSTPRALNINAAFGVYAPLQPYFSSYLAYETTLVLLAASLFFGLETVARIFVGVAGPERPALPDRGSGSPDCRSGGTPGPSREAMATLAETTAVAAAKSQT